MNTWDLKKKFAKVVIMLPFGVELIIIFGFKDLINNANLKVSIKSLNGLIEREKLIFLR